MSLQQQENSSRNAIGNTKNLSIDKQGEVAELFVELDGFNESLLKKAVSFIRQRLESADEGALEVELIDITLRLTTRRRRRLLDYPQQKG